jgi:predicted nucleic acid-binding protein
MPDTDTCAFVLRRTSDTLLERIQAVPVLRQVMSVVTDAELLCGVRAPSKKKGSMIGANGVLVAAPARSAGALEAANNTKDSTRGEGLGIENRMT